MAELTTRASCASHPDQLGIALCDHCGKPLCAECRVEAIAANEVYCSQSCRDTHEATTVHRLLAGLEHPFITGWGLWARSQGTLILHTTPVAFLMLLFLLLATAGGPTNAEGAMSDWAPLGLVLLFVYGIALTGALLSQRYTGLVRGNAHVWTLRRVIPWAVTWVLMFVFTLVGYFALIIPGIILALRLFWADEFALAHRTGPIRSLKESWHLTRGQTGTLFGFQFLSGLASWAVVAAGGAVFLLMEQTIDALYTLGVLGSAYWMYIFSILFFILIFSGYGAIHAPELAKFYGMRAALGLHERRSRDGNGG